MTSPSNNSSSVFHRQLIDENGIDKATGFSPEGQEQRFRVILQRCFRTPLISKKILDYGCNVGGLLDYVWPSGGHFESLDYTGVDLVTEFLVRLKEKYPRAKTLMGTITDIDDFNYLKEGGPYDYVVASGVFCYADESHRNEAMLQRLWDLTSDTLAVNFLTDPIQTERRTSKVTHCLYHPGYGSQLAQALGCKYYNVFHDYRENDFTVALYRKPA